MRPRLRVWNDNGTQITLYRGVFERSAPVSLIRIEPMLNPPKIGNGAYAWPITEERLAALTGAYREAAGQAAQSQGAEASTDGPKEPTTALRL